jgi:hypothetical protein
VLPGRRGGVGTRGDLPLFDVPAVVLAVALSSIPVTTSAPSASRPPMTAVCEASEVLTRTGTRSSRPSRSTHTTPCRPMPSTATGTARVPLAGAASSPAAGACWPSAVNTSADGRSRSAALGTRSAPAARSISTVTFAVMPGLSFRSWFRTSIVVT